MAGQVLGPADRADHLGQLGRATERGDAGLQLGAAAERVERGQHGPGAAEVADQLQHPGGVAQLVQQPDDVLEPTGGVDQPHRRSRVTDPVQDDQGPLDAAQYPDRPDRLAQPAQAAGQLGNQAELRDRGEAAQLGQAQGGQADLEQRAADQTSPLPPAQLGSGDGQVEVVGRHRQAGRQADHQQGDDQDFPAEQHEHEDADNHDDNDDHPADQGGNQRPQALEQVEDGQPDALEKAEQEAAQIPEERPDRTEEAAALAAADPGLPQPGVEVGHEARQLGVLLGQAVVDLPGHPGGLLADLTLPGGGRLPHGGGRGRVGVPARCPHLVAAAGERLGHLLAGGVDRLPEPAAQFAVHGRQPVVELGGAGRDLGVGRGGGLRDGADELAGDGLVLGVGPVDLRGDVGHRLAGALRLPAALAHLLDHPVDLGQVPRRGQVEHIQGLADLLIDRGRHAGLARAQFLNLDVPVLPQPDGHLPGGVLQIRHGGVRRLPDRPDRLGVAEADRRRGPGEEFRQLGARVHRLAGDVAGDLPGLAPHASGDVLRRGPEALLDLLQPASADLPDEPRGPLVARGCAGPLVDQLGRPAGPRLAAGHRPGRLGLPRLAGQAGVRPGSVVNARVAVLGQPRQPVTLGRRGGQGLRNVLALRRTDLLDPPGEVLLHLGDRDVEQLADVLRLGGEASADRLPVGRRRLLHLGPPPGRGLDHALPLLGERGQGGDQDAGAVVRAAGVGRGGARSGPGELRTVAGGAAVRGLGGRRARRAGGRDGGDRARYAASRSRGGAAHRADRACVGGQRCRGGAVPGRGCRFRSRRRRSGGGDGRRRCGGEGVGRWRSGRHCSGLHSRGDLTIPWPTRDFGRGGSGCRRLRDSLTAVRRHHLGDRGAFGLDGRCHSARVYKPLREFLRRARFHAKALAWNRCGCGRLVRRKGSNLSRASSGGPRRLRRLPLRRSRSGGGGRLSPSGPATQG